uniref:glycosyltransferase family 2 protein n=1 Tax=Thaumasiovibrio occultus TaxID=1891184 RepID=UPI000B35CF43|nr:glycosyltransferase family 2 protein [Thaumasiovibrio occultus]
MSQWLKNKFISVLKHKQQSRNSGEILQCIDLCGVYQNHLVIKGWCTDDSNNTISISILTEDSKTLSLIAGRNEQRPDVIEHLGLMDKELLLGFCHIYNVAEDFGELTVCFRNEKSNVSVPLDFNCSKDLDDQIRVVCETFGVSFCNMAGEENIDVYSRLQEQEQEQEQAVINPIRHYIEEAGSYKGKIALIRGWCLDIESHKNVQVVSSQTGISTKIIKYFQIDRPDVANCFDAGDKACPYGFLLLLDITKLSNDPIELCFSNEEHKVVIPLLLDKELSKQHLENNLTDGKLLTVSESKAFLLEQLGATYLAELQSEIVDVQQVQTKMHIDSGLSLDNGCFIRGWLDDSRSEIEMIRITDGNVLSVNILPSLTRNIRLDVNDAFPHLTSAFKAGFFCYSEVKDYSAPLYALVIEKSGKVVKLPLELGEVISDEVLATQQVLAQIDPYASDLFDIYEKHVAPSLLGIWKARTTLPSREETSVTLFGNQVAKPTCSVIVPLYGRFDFVLHQLAQFELDDDFKDVELIYVIDDPRIDQATKAMCDDISKLYNVSFKLVSCGRNLGFAGANNLGVKYASSDHLLLLNSDVLPSESGWLRRLLTAYKSTNNIGALGVKLVFEDESIQHIGMDFSQSREFGGLWLNNHPYKGLPENLVPQIGLEPVATVTAACLLVERAKFQEISGFDTQYILGDFEDSDLCLKLLDAGYDNYILGTEKLYHLERLSQSLVQQGDWKFKLTLFNGWQHTKRWDHLIRSLEA